MNIKRNIESVLSELKGSGAKLVAVSKTRPPEEIMEAYAAGQRIFGENKVQELLAKRPELPDDIEWHLIGHLQTNKVKSIVSHVAMIHGVDSVRLALEINKQAVNAGKHVQCLLQVHIAEEETKFGFSPDELLQFITSTSVQSLANIQIKGLMGMATFTEDKDQIRKEFRGLRKLFDEIKSRQVPGIEMTELSMGMSSDYKIALEEGSTLVRIGTSIFGERITNKQTA